MKITKFAELMKEKTIPILDKDFEPDLEHNITIVDYELKLLDPSLLSVYKDNLVRIIITLSKEISYLGEWKPDNSKYDVYVYSYDPDGYWGAFWFDGPASEITDLGGTDAFIHEVLTGEKDLFSTRGCSIASDIKKGEASA